MLLSSSNRCPGILSPLYFLPKHFVDGVQQSLAAESEIGEGAHLVGGFQIPGDDMQEFGRKRKEGCRLLSKTATYQ
jgi:hypothetical protein